MAAKITRDAQGRIVSYHVDTRYGAALPSKNRIREVIRQANKAGATRAGIVADVGQFQAYEAKKASRQTVRAFRRGDSANALRSRLGASNQNARAAVLGELRAASGADQVRDLRGFQINFYYP